MWSPAGPAPTMQTLSTWLGPGILGKGFPLSPASLLTVESNILSINGFARGLQFLKFESWMMKMTITYNDIYNYSYPIKLKTNWMSSKGWGDVTDTDIRIIIAQWRIIFIFISFDSLTECLSQVKHFYNEAWSYKQLMSFLLHFYATPSVKD